MIFNVLVQLAIGLPLEMLHGSFRISLIYLAGVLAGGSFQMKSTCFSIIINKSYRTMIMKYDIIIQKYDIMI